MGKIEKELEFSTGQFEITEEFLETEISLIEFAGCLIDVGRDLLSCKEILFTKASMNHHIHCLTASLQSLLLAKEEQRKEAH